MTGHASNNIQLSGSRQKYSSTRFYFCALILAHLVLRFDVVVYKFTSGSNVTPSRSQSLSGRSLNVFRLGAVTIASGRLYIPLICDTTLEECFLTSLVQIKVVTSKVMFSGVTVLKIQVIGDGFFVA